MQQPTHERHDHLTVLAALLHSFPQAVLTAITTPRPGTTTLTTPLVRHTPTP